MLNFQKEKLGIFFISCFFACKISNPTILVKEKCDENKIEQHIEKCVPKTANVQELEYYKVECEKEATRLYCSDVRMLVIRGREIPCPDVPEKYKYFCQ